MCRNFVKGIDKKGRLLRDYRAEIFFDATKSKLKVIASDDSKLDGFNASLALLDEFHCAPNSKVKDVIKSSMGMRENPMLIITTTAGFDKTLPCYQLRTVALEVVNIIKDDDSLFCIIRS